MTSRRILVAVLCLSAAACADFSRGEPSPAADAGGGGDDGGTSADGASVALSFATDVFPLLDPTCARCHAPGQQAGDTTLLFAGNAAADYATVLRFVDTSAPAGSRLLAKMSGRGHGGGTLYGATSPQFQTILQWIQQGARP